MLGQGQLLDAFDKYYAENIVMTEPRGTREGKQVCRDYEVQFLNNILQQKLHSPTKPLSYSANHCHP